MALKKLNNKIASESESGLCNQGTKRGAERRGMQHVSQLSSQRAASVTFMEQSKHTEVVIRRKG